MPSGCFYLRKFRVMSLPLAPGKSVSDYMKLRLVFCNPTVVPPKIRSDASRDSVASPPLQGTQMMLGKLWAWAGAENDAYPVMVVVILCYLIVHTGFMWIANMLLLTNCISKRVLWLRRAQAGGYVGLTLVCCLCCLALPAPSVHNHTAQRWAVALPIEINGLIFNALLNLHDLLCRVVCLTHRL